MNRDSNFKLSRKSREIVRSLALQATASAGRCDISNVVQILAMLHASFAQHVIVTSPSSHWPAPGMAHMVILRRPLSTTPPPSLIAFPPPLHQHLQPYRERHQRLQTSHIKRAQTTPIVVRPALGKFLSCFFQLELTNCFHLYLSSKHVVMMAPETTHPTPNCRIPPYATTASPCSQGGW